MPRPDGTVLLPMDMPPSKRQAHAAGGAVNVAGLAIAGSAGEVAVQLPTVPWNPWESQSFPAVEQSMAAANLGQPPSVRPQQPGSPASAVPQLAPGSPFPVRAGNPSMNALRPKWVVAINSYSPVSHRTPAQLRDGVPPRAISARGVGAVTQRPRGYAPGYVTNWPQASPRWPSFREAPNTARRG